MQRLGLSQITGICQCKLIKRNMDIYDKLENWEVLIKKCEYRLRKDDFEHLFFITRQLIDALEVEVRFELHKQRLKNRLSDISGFLGTSNSDLATLRAFDYHKRTLLNTIHRVKKQIIEIELEL